MKKLLCLILTVALLVTMLSFMAVTAFADGEGDSADNPILIYNGNWNDLTANGLETNKFYKLVEDIGTKETPTEKYFTKDIPTGARFDGDGHTVWVNVNNFLFGINNNGEIYNVIVDGTVSANAVFCNTNYGTISHCVNRVNMNGNYYAFGICYSNFGTINCCENYGYLTAEFNATGICKTNSQNGIICNCINYGDIKADNTAAGIVANNNFSSKCLLNCVNIGSIEAKNTTGICYTCNSPAELCFNCGLPNSGDRVAITNSSGKIHDCWYMQYVNGTRCNSSGATAVSEHDDIDKVIGQMNAKAEDYRKNKYPDIEIRNWIKGPNGLPTVNLCIHEYDDNGICVKCNYGAKEPSVVGALLSSGSIIIICVVGGVALVTAGVFMGLYFNKKKKSE